MYGLLRCREGQDTGNPPRSVEQDTVWVHLREERPEHKGWGNKVLLSLLPHNYVNYICYSNTQSLSDSEEWWVTY